MNDSENLKNAKFQVNLLILIIFILSNFIVFILPLSSIYSAEGFHQLILWCSHFIPMIEKLATNSSFPEVIQIYFAIFWTTLPFIAVYMFYLITELERPHKEFRMWQLRVRKKLYVSLILITPILIFGASSLIGRLGNTSLSGNLDSLMRTNRFMLACLGSVLFITLSTLIAMSTYYAILYIRIYMNNNHKH